MTNCLLAVFDYCVYAVFALDRLLFRPEPPHEDFEVIESKTYFARNGDYDSQDIGYWLDGSRYNIVYGPAIVYPPFKIGQKPHGATGPSSRLFEELQDVIAHIEYKRKLRDIIRPISPITLATTSDGQDITALVRRYAGPAGDFYKAQELTITAHHVLRNISADESMTLTIYDNALEPHVFEQDDELHA